MDEQPVTRANPYPGPQPFKRRENLDDPGRLYGRERETYELNCLLVAERIVLLYSPSGAGKTSLVQAAVIPALQEEGFRVLPSIRLGLGSAAETGGMKPANRYVHSAMLSLQAARAGGAPLAPESLPCRLKLEAYLNCLPSPLPRSTDSARPSGKTPDWRGDVLIDSLPCPLPRSADGAHPSRKTPGWRGDVLIFDQFEELLTLDPTDEAGKRAFFAQVGAALQNERRWALFSMREDFIAALDPYRQSIPTALTNRYRLDLLKVSQAMDAMIGPARDASPSVTFTPGAAKTLAENLAAKGLYVEPVQLQVVCRDLWDRPRSNPGLIDESVVAQVKNVETSLADYYARSVKIVAGGDVGREATIRDWVDTRLITPGGRRGQVLLEDKKSQGLDEATIRDLVDAHLVRAEYRGNNTWFELAHDRLVEPVRANNETWRNDNLSEFEKQARVWNAQGRPDGLLLLGPALAAAENWATGRTLTEDQREFLDESRKAEEAAERDRRQRRRIRNLAVAAATAAVFALILAGLAWAARNTANEQRSIAVAARGEAETQRNVAVTARADAETQRNAAVVARGVAEEQRNAAQVAKKRALEQAQIANARALAAASIAELERDPELSILLARASDEITRTAEGEDAMRRALYESRIAQRLAIPGVEKAAATGPGPANTSRLTRAVYSPDGKRLAISGPAAGVAIFELDKPRAAPLILDFAGTEAGPVVDLAFSPDGARLATAHGLSDGTVADFTARIWDASNGELQKTLAGHSDWLTSVAFSPDGKYLATGSMDDTALLWDLSAGDEPDGSFEGHEGDVTDVAFGPNGVLATASRDGTVRLWGTLAEAYAKPELDRLQNHEDRVLSVAFSPDGTRMASGSTDKTVILWNVAWDPTGKLAGVTANQRLYDHTDSIPGVEFSPNGRCLATASRDRTARVWNASDGRQLLALLGHEDGLESATFRPAPDETRTVVGEAEFCGLELATASYDGTARLWNVGPTAEKATYLGHLLPVESVVYNADQSRLLTGSDDGTAKVWDAATGKPLLDLKGEHQGRINKAIYSPDGRTIATASWDGSVGLWDAQTGAWISRIGEVTPAESADVGRNVVAADSQSIHGLAFSPDGKTVATARNDGQIDLWDAQSGLRLDPAPVYGDSFYSVHNAPDGSEQIATGAGGAIEVWAGDQPEKLRTLRHGEEEVYDAAFSPDGTLLATISWDGTGALWRWPAGEQLRTLTGHTDRLLGVGFTPDGRQLITSGADGTARVWDVATGGLVRTLHGPELNGLAINKDGKTVVIGGEDGTVRVYTLDPDELFALAKTRVTRELTEAERAQYLSAVSPE